MASNELPESSPPQAHMLPQGGKTNNKQMIKSLEEENKRLFEALVERDREYEALKASKSGSLKGSEGASVGGINATGMSDLSSEVEHLARQLRAATSKASRERSLRDQWEKRCKELESQVKTQQLQLQGPEDHQVGRQRPKDEIEQEVQRLSKKVSQLSIQNSRLQAEMSSARNALRREIGDDEVVERALAGEAVEGWKGRAEQIQRLQLRLKKTSLDRPAPSPRSSSHSSLVSGLPDISGGGGRTKLNDLEGEVESLRQKLETSEANATRASARSAALHTQVQTLQTKLSEVVTKTEHDDELIDLLLAKLGLAKGSQARDLVVADSALITRLQGEIARLNGLLHNQVPGQSNPTSSIASSGTSATPPGGISARSVIPNVSDNMSPQMYQGQGQDRDGESLSEFYEAEARMWKGQYDKLKERLKRPGDPEPGVLEAQLRAEIAALRKRLSEVASSM